MTFVGLLLPGILTLRFQDAQAERTLRSELRPASDFPTLQTALADPSAFPDRFEGAWNDRFVLRSAALGLHSLIRYSLRANSVYGSGRQEILVGRDGWLFLANDRDVIEQFTGRDLLSAQELRSWTAALRRLDELADGEFVFAVVPNKHRVYPEKLPGWIVGGTQTQLDQIRGITRGTSLSVVDLTSEILRAKTGGQKVYYETDSHWTPLGAMAGYNEIARETGLPTIPSDRVTSSQGPPRTFGSTKMMGLEFLIKEPSIQLRFSRPPRHERRILLIHDSFGAKGLISSLDVTSKPQVQRVHIRDVDEGLAEAIADADLTIWLIVERLLNNHHIPNRVRHALRREL